jgi:type IV pilus assembly protein PilA
MKQDQKGLTLIESMMVFAVIGILATIAIPPAYQFYQDSQAREQVTEAVRLLESVRSPVAKFYSGQGRWPTKAEFDDLVATQAGKYVTSLTPSALTNGFAVTAKFRNDGVSPELLKEGTGRTLVLATTNGRDWFCNDNTDPVTGISSLVPGTVLPQHRPSLCRQKTP